MASVNITVNKDNATSITLNGTVTDEVADQVATLLSGELVKALQVPTAPEVS